LKKVINCTYDGKKTNPSSLYAFDLSGLSDALVFEHNSINHLQPALRLSYCNNGSITSNILNNKVRIEDSKAIVFHSNHMENGAQLEIADSNVTSMNNFFWKGTQPSLIMQSPNDGQVSVVKSSGDMFMFYDKRASDTSAYDIDTINEYDVQITNSCIVEFSQTYRYWVLVDNITVMYPFGIKVCKKTGINPSTGEPILDPVTEFNDQSYLLSSESRIMRGYHVINSAYINNLLAPTASGSGHNSYCKWHNNTGNYYYKYLILWDRNRRIVGNSGNFTWNSGSYIPLTKNSNGVLINVANASTDNGGQVMLRLYRSTNSSFPVDSTTQFIDIPITGTRYLYDNGTSICGFKWEILTNNENIFVIKTPTLSTNANLNITSIRYSGVNIECKAPDVPSYGTWQEGDIVYNTGTSSSIAYWIYLGGAWRTKQ
jgi:hypothetical protein